MAGTSRTGNYSKAELKAGFMVLMSLVVFLVFFGAINRQWESWFTKDSKTFHALFSDTLGLNKGADVRFGGAKVGRITSIELDKNSPTSIRITIEVDQETPVNEEGVAFIGQVTLMAEKHLEITTGSREAALLADGAMLDVREGGLMSQAANVATTVRETLEDVVDLLGVDGSDNPDEELVSLADLFESIETTITESTGLVEDARGIVADSKQDLDEILENVQEIEVRVEELIDDMAALFEESRGDLSNSLDRVSHILDRVGKTADDLDGMANSLTKTLEHAESLSSTANGMAEDNRPVIEDVILDLRETVRHLKEFSRTIADEPQSVLRGAEPKGRSGER